MFCRTHDQVFARCCVLEQVPREEEPEDWVTFSFLYFGIMWCIFSGVQLNPVFSYDELCQDPQGAVLLKAGTDNQECLLRGSSAAAADPAAASWNYFS